MSWRDKSGARQPRQNGRVVTLGRLEIIAVALLMTALVAACGPSNKPIPSDPKARSEFLSGAAAKLTTGERKLLDRFLLRLDAQTAAGGKAADVSVSRALELERGYEAQILAAQRNVTQMQESANAALSVEVSEPSVVPDPKAQPPKQKALRFVVNVTNRGSRKVENLSLRVEFRDSAGKYQAVIPSLDVNGTLLPGDLGRLVQMLPLDAQRHQYILDGKPLQISAYPIRIAYGGGEVLEPGKELKTLESLYRTKIE